MIFENDSLPTPLSPVIKTLMSVGATLIAVSRAWFNAGELPTISNRFLMLCNSI